MQPYIALGQALRSLGNTCTILTTLDHESLVRAYGLDVVTIPVNVSEELRQVEARRAVEGGGVISSFRQFADIAKRSARTLVEVGLDACRGADVIVTNFTTALVAGGLSQKLRVPVVQAFNVPVTPTAAFPGALFPRLDLGGVTRRLGHRLTRAALWLTSRAAANEACVTVLGVEPAPRLPGRSAGLLPGPVLYGFSEALLARPADWPSNARVTGFWFVDEPPGFAPPDALVRFLEAGPPPVCIGFGSMSTEKPEQVSELVLDAATRAGARVVLLGGWAGLKPEAFSKDVFALAACPHSWLYPRCRAVVHHGGAGTTAAAVHAGVPAVVVPFHGDQFFWASRVRRERLGPEPIARGMLTAQRLASAIERATMDDELRETCRAVGLRVRAERGALVAATMIAEGRAASSVSGAPFNTAA